MTPPTQPPTVVWLWESCDEEWDSPRSSEWARFDFDGNSFGPYVPLGSKVVPAADLEEVLEGVRKIESQCAGHSDEFSGRVAGIASELLKRHGREG